MGTVKIGYWSPAGAGTATVEPAELESRLEKLRASGFVTWRVGLALTRPSPTGR